MHNQASAATSPVHGQEPNCEDSRPEFRLKAGHTCKPAERALVQMNSQSKALLHSNAACLMPQMKQLLGCARFWTQLVMKALQAGRLLLADTASVSTLATLPKVRVLQNAMLQRANRSFPKEALPSAETPEACKRALCLQLIQFRRCRSCCPKAHCLSSKQLTPSVRDSAVKPGPMS